MDQLVLSYDNPIADFNFYCQVQLQQREQKMTSLTEETHRLTATVDMLQLELEQANAGVSNLNATHKVEKDELNRNIKEKEELVEGLQQMNTAKDEKILIISGEIEQSRLDAKQLQEELAQKGSES